MIPFDTGWAWFFDIDGTLIEFADTPEGAVVDARLQDLILELQSRTGGATALISGRDIASIDRLFPGAPLPVAGQHGVERRDAQGRMSHHAFPSQRIEAAAAELTAGVEQHPGLLLEHKGLSLALHYRRAPTLGSYAHRLAHTALKHLGARYCLQYGKFVVELKPAGKDKGVAILEFMHEPPFQSRVPIFIGDDATDEYGFAMVQRLHGHTVKVGPGDSAAEWRLADVPHVRSWLTHGLAAVFTP
ncbi:MAG: trehalose-phosphatase [Gemmatimonadales bacterium]